LRLKGVPVRWLTEITERQPTRSFTDVPAEAWAVIRDFVLAAT
jgi:predicted alpha-1,6-mannanase (GH76 family)